MATKATIIEHDRIIYSVNMVPIGVRPAIAQYEASDQYYDLYVNGLHVVASGTLYLTASTTGVLSAELPILVDGEDSGKTGQEYEFDVISEYCLKVNQCQPEVNVGDLDFIFVEDDNLYQLSKMYDYGYHKISVEVGPNY